MNKMNVLVCRCEEVTKEEIQKAINQGARSLLEIKRATRAGMGLCQGRTCNKLIARILSEETGLKLSEIEPISYRSPLRPITIEELSSTETDDCDGNNNK